MRLLLLLLLIGETYASSRTQSFLPGSFTLLKKQKQFLLRSDYFQSAARFDYDGNEDTQTEDESFARIQSNLGFRYGISNKLMLELGARYRMNQAKFSAGGQSYALDSSGLESYYGFVRYSMPSPGRWRFALQGGVRTAAYSNSPYDATRPYDFLVLGDSGNLIHFGLNTSYESLGGNHFIINSHLRSHSKLSEEIFYDVKGVLHWTKFALIAGVRGLFSLSGDEYAVNPADKPSIGEQNTNLYNGVDREYIEPYGQINFGLGDRWRLELQSGMRMSGVSTDKGLFGMFGIVFTSGGVSQKKIKVDSFKEYYYEASVVKVSQGGRFCRVDKGVSDHFEKGMRVDIYEDNYVGGNRLIASGVVYDAKATFSIVRILKYYKKGITVESGHVVRGK